MPVCGLLNLTKLNLDNIPCLTQLNTHSEFLTNVEPCILLCSFLILILFNFCVLQHSILSHFLNESINSSIASKWIPSTFSHFGRHTLNTQVCFGEGSTKIHSETHDTVRSLVHIDLVAWENLVHKQEYFGPVCLRKSLMTPCDQVHINIKCRNKSWAILPQLTT